MKKIFKDKILNIERTDRFDNTFLFEYIQNPLPQPLSKRGEQEIVECAQKIGIEKDDLYGDIVQANHRLPYNKSLSDTRKELKKNITFHEKKLWNQVCKPLQNKYGIRILQQRIIGNFIVDFFISHCNLVIELDGESHFDMQGVAYDKERTEILEGYGLKVIRFSNAQVEANIQAVFDEIELYIQKQDSSSLGEGVRGRGNVEIIYIGDLLEKKKNAEILERVVEKPAMYSEVYSPKDELEIFTGLFDEALRQNKKIHIVGVTLAEEIQMLEKYYEELGFVREDINAFDVDFSVPMVTVSCHIENLMWRGSDYKAQKEKIFFCPPVRESGQNKALFKGITRGVIAGIELGEFTPEKQAFIGDCIRGEKILPLHMGKVLKYNLEELGLRGENNSLIIEY